MQGPWEVGSRHPLDDWSNTYIGIHYNGPKGQYKCAFNQPSLPTLPRVAVALFVCMVATNLAALRP